MSECGGGACASDVRMYIHTYIHDLCTYVHKPYSTYVLYILTLSMVPLTILVCAVCTYIRMYTYVYVYVCFPINKTIIQYMCMHVCTYIRTVCMYIHMYVHYLDFAYVMWAVPNTISADLH